MELRNLRNFSIVAECLNISDAAALIHITQPALSRQLNQLEQRLGFTLFDRHSSGVTLTEQGSAFFRSTEKVLSFIEEAILEARHIGSGNGSRLNVGFHSALMPVSFCQCLHEFGLANPDIPITLTEASPRSLMSQLRSRALDVIVLAPDTISIGADLEESCLPNKRMHILIHSQHRFASAVRIDLASMATESLIVLGERQSPGMRARALHACRRVGFEPPTVIEANSYSVMLGLVAAVQGYALDSEETDACLDNVAVRSIPTLQVWVSPGDSLVWQRDTISEPRSALVDCLLRKRKGQRVVILPQRAIAV